MSTYDTPQAFRQALEERLKAAARQRSRPVNELRRDLVLRCYLSRLFTLVEGPWLLKGGTSLVLRVPGARHTKDLDLHRPGPGVVTDAEPGLQQLTAAGRRSTLDPFVFDISRKKELAGNTPGIRVTATARLGATRFESFPIDWATTEIAPVGPVETVQQELPVQIDGIQDPSPCALYPLADQMADKVVAMYETHHGRPSGRYHDLVDLVLIIESGLVVDATVLALALRQQGTRRGVTLPQRLRSPGPAWPAGYQKNARDAGLPTDLHSLDAGLERVGIVINPALATAAPER